MATARLQTAHKYHLCSKCNCSIEPGSKFYKVGHQEFVHVDCFGYHARHSFDDFIHEVTEDMEVDFSEESHALELYYENEDDEPW